MPARKPRNPKPPPPPHAPGIASGRLSFLQFRAPVATLACTLPFPRHTNPLGCPESMIPRQKLLPGTGPDPETISAPFGKKSKAKTNEIKENIETLKSLGKLG